MIIGITGTDGAGKGTVVDYLVKNHGFTHYSSRGFIIEEIERRGLVVDRDVTREVGNDLRREFGADVLVKRALEAIEKNGVTNAIIESIRSVGEAETLKAVGGALLAIDADQEVRYARNASRGTALDAISFETFQEQEAKEMNDTTPGGMQKAKVMEMADYTILNETTEEELFKQVESIFSNIVM